MSRVIPPKGYKKLYLSDQSWSGSIVQLRVCSRLYLHRDRTRVWNRNSAWAYLPIRTRDSPALEAETNRRIRIIHEVHNTKLHGKAGRRLIRGRIAEGKSIRFLQLHYKQWQVSNLLVTFSRLPTTSLTEWQYAPHTAIQRRPDLASGQVLTVK